MQRYLYRKLTDVNLTKTRYYLFNWLAHKFQDKEQYTEAVRRIVGFVYSRADSYFKNEMLLGISNIVVLNKVVIIFAVNSDFWVGDNGIGIQTLTNETQLNIRIIEDRWSTKHDIREQRILNRI